MDKTALLNLLMVSYGNAHPDKKKATIQKEVHSLWNSLKEEKLEDNDLETRVKSLVKSFNEKAMTFKSKQLSFWSKTPKQSAPKSIPLEFDKNSSQFEEPTDEVSVIADQHQPTTSSSTSSGAKNPRKPKTAAQDRLNSEIGALNCEIAGLKTRKRSGFITEAEEDDLKKKKMKLTDLTKELAKKKYDQAQQQKTRDLKKSRMEKLCLEHPEVEEKLKIRKNPGRPSLEVDQPLLLKAIIDIAVHGSAADERRRSEVLRVILFII